MTIRLKGLLAALVVLLATGCGTKKPVLYPNARFQTVGNETAQRDIDQCMQLAHESGADSGKTGEVAKDTAKAGAIGGATGAVVGAIAGDVGRGAAIGAAGVATASLMSGLFNAADHDPLFMRFVEQCLRERGYDPIGWK